MFIQKNISQRYTTIIEGLKGDHVKVLVDTNCIGVVLPIPLNDGNVVPIKISYLFQGALHLDEQQIEAELRFANKYHTCKFPLASIKAVSFSSGETYIFTEELETTPVLELQIAEKVSPTDAPKARPTLTRIK